MAGVVIVTGSEDWKNVALLWQVLMTHGPALVVHGGCQTGVDEIADRWCRRMGVDSHVMRLRGKSRIAYRVHQRDARMLETYPGAHVLAFPPSKFGDVCMKRARELGHPVTVYGPTGSPIDYLIAEAGILNG